MFTGLIEEIGTVKSISANRDGKRLVISSVKVTEDIAIKESISVNGVCLTVTECSGNSFAVDVVMETLNRSNIEYLSAGDKVNLERAMSASARFGGHFVQGHVDCSTEIISFVKRDKSADLKVKVPDNMLRFIVEKGSICLDGISLTVASIENDMMTVALIPHTLGITTLGDRIIGDKLNVEVDILAKYIQNGLENHFKNDAKLTNEDLLNMGY